jgi:crotonobetainyl-CoA:carnitine CoA-transferase CaiB-like acyl-CoA transferase
MNAQQGGPLAGIRVIDLTIWMAGPIASMLLADLGADVIKIEGANGDPSRASRGTGGDLRPGTPLSLAWTTCNRNKRALTLDLGRDESRPVFHRLLESADVFLTNLHLQTLKKLRADEESVHAVNPNLIYARAAGLGDRGPRANDHCQDMTGMAYAGLLFTYSSRDDVPFAPPGAMNDASSSGSAPAGDRSSPDRWCRPRCGHNCSTSGASPTPRSE